MTPIWNRELSPAEHRRIRELILSEVFEGRRTEDQVNWSLFELFMSLGKNGLQVDVYDWTVKRFVLNYFPDREKAEARSDAEADSERVKVIRDVEAIWSVESSVDDGVSNEQAGQVGSDTAKPLAKKRRVAREIRSAWAVEEAK